ncbi:hypothetical protein EJ110_NYTH05617 [Nymphaea thermarum]|nr:hypothetical protein EJ110_NYTH05617 [Nymphaea thermarum]
MQTDDEWLAPDKLYHVLFCFSVALASAELTRRCGHSLLRRRSISIGSLVSTAAGAAKEIGDEMGFWTSGGGSIKDAVADLSGVLLAATILWALALPPPPPPPKGSHEDPYRFHGDSAV